MSPHPIDHRASKEWIVGTGHPSRKLLSRIVIASELKNRTAQRFWQNPFTGPWVDHMAFVLKINDLVCRHFRVRESTLAADAGKDGGQPVIVALAPAFKGMVVALRTLNTHAEKRLGN